MFFLRYSLENLFQVHKQRAQCHGLLENNNTEAFKKQALVMVYPLDIPKAVLIRQKTKVHWRLMTESDTRQVWRKIALKKRAVF